MARQQIFRDGVSVNVPSAVADIWTDFEVLCAALRHLSEVEADRRWNTILVRLADHGYTIADDPGNDSPLGWVLQPL
jgi:hypothetical protein